MLHEQTAVIQKSNCSKYWIHESGRKNSNLQVHPSFQSLRVGWTCRLETFLSLSWIQYILQLLFWITAVCSCNIFILFVFAYFWYLLASIISAFFSMILSLLCLDFHLTVCYNFFISNFEKVHQAVINAGKLKSGCTVHLVTEQVTEF